MTARRSGAARLLLAVAVLVPVSGCAAGSDPAAQPSPAASSTVPTDSSQPATTAAAGDAPASDAAASEGPASEEPVSEEPVSEQPVATDAPRPATTDVVLSTVSWEDAAAVVDAGGYVSPVVESGGTCTLRLTKDGEVVTVSTAGLPDATTTVCGGLRTEPGVLQAGRWTAVLSYRSAATEGTSAPVRVEVPR